MHALSRRWSALVLSLALAGCGAPVREDRFVNWDADGGQVGFQHGREGVFLADREGGGLRKIFQPDPSVIATSSPLWAPAGKRALFTTARPIERPDDPSGQGPGIDDPAGNLHVQRPVVYTCWLYEEGVGGEKAAPRQLFESRCDHPGYVAANLAVRWAPDGKSVYYLSQTAEHRHALFAFDLESGRSARAFPHEAEALLFDWSPDGTALACVLGGNQARPETDGLWVGLPGVDGWWHVPHSADLPPGELPSALERLRAGRPAWTADGTRLAYVTFSPGRTEDERGRYFLRTAVPASGEQGLLAEGEEPFRDLQWSKDGRLGVVHGGTLSLLRPGREGAVVNRVPVRRFAGWDATGERLAYVVPAPVAGGEGPWWSFLMIPDPAARDAVVVTDGEGRRPGETVFSGLRVTFPRWSPREDKLSLWVTFSPSHHSLLSLLPLGGGMLPGDPAAVLDLKTKRLDWMAVNAEEKLQVGHYFLFRRDYAEAWRWYEQAGREAAPAPAPPRDVTEWLRRLSGPRHSGAFQSYYLSQLGRKQEARAKLDEFRRAFPPRFAGPPEDATAPDLARHLREWLRDDGLPVRLMQDGYLAEMFLSLDAVAEGEAFFRAALAEARDEGARLSAALVLSQLLLLEGRHEAYAELATETLAPLLPLLVAEGRRSWLGNAAGMAGPMDRLGLYALLPLAAPDFVAGLPRDAVVRLLPRWQRLRARATEPGVRRDLDLVLHALHGRLGQERERREVAARFSREHAANAGLPTPDNIGPWIDDLRRRTGPRVSR